MLFETTADRLPESRGPGAASCDDSRPWTAADIEQEHGLEMLQLASKRVAPAAGKESAVTHATDGPLRQKGELTRDEEDLLDFQDANHTYVRFLAQHKDWRDFIDFYQDGFFQRFYSNDAGAWSIKNGELILDWLRDGAEILYTSDKGRSFTRGPDFSLRSHYAPAWFQEIFKKEDEEEPEWTYEFVSSEARPDSRPTQTYGESEADAILQHAMHSNKKVGWKCYDYNVAAAESHEWCKASPKRGGYEYAFNGGLFNQCGGCWCCYREESYGAESSQVAGTDREAQKGTDRKSVV